MRPFLTLALSTRRSSNILVRSREGRAHEEVRNQAEKGHQLGDPPDLTRGGVESPPDEVIIDHDSLKQSKEYKLHRKGEHKAVRRDQVLERRPPLRQPPKVRPSEEDPQQRVDARHAIGPQEALTLSQLPFHLAQVVQR